METEKELVDSFLKDLRNNAEDFSNNWSNEKELELRYIGYFYFKGKEDQMNELIKFNDRFLVDYDSSVVVHKILKTRGGSYEKFHTFNKGCTSYCMELIKEIEAVL